MKWTIFSYGSIHFRMRRNFYNVQIDLNGRIIAFRHINKADSAFDPASVPAELAPHIRHILEHYFELKAGAIANIRNSRKRRKGQ